MKARDYKTIAAVTAVAVLFPVAAHAAIVDDFDGDTIDFAKWRNYDTNHTWEVIRDVDPVAGELVMGAASDGSSGFPTGFGRSALIVHDDPVESLEALGKVRSVDAGSSGQGAYIAVEGNYYNADTASPSEYTGDVWASTMIGDWGSGLEARYEILKSTNADFTAWDIVDEGSISTGPLSLDNFYDLKVGYDGGNGFSFTVNGTTASANGPPREGEAFTGYQRLGALVEDGDDPVSVVGRFDDVVVNDDAMLYDDFSDERLDPDKWFQDPVRFGGTYLAEVRQADSGKLQLDIQGERVGDALGPRNRLMLQEINPDYVEAMVSIPSDIDMDDNMEGAVGITGFLYNERRDGGDMAQAYDGADGDVWGTVYLFTFNGNLGAWAYLESELADFSTDEVLKSEGFAATLETGKEYRLWMERTDDQIIFGLDGETITEEAITYDVMTPMYEPSPAALGGYRALRTAINGTSSAAPSAGGIARGTFDDVRTDPSRSGTDDGGLNDGGSNDGGSNDGGSDDGGSGGSGGGGGGTTGLLFLTLLAGFGILGGSRRR